MRNLTWTCSILAAMALAACTGDADGDGYKGDEDCDDSSASVNNGAEEICDGLDNDCDGEIDEDATDALTFFADADGDGSGDPETTVAACEAPAGYLTDSSDCDDGDDAVFPGADEVCNDTDDDCDDDVDEDAIDAPS